MAVDDKAVYQQNHISIINKLMYRYCFFLFLTISTVQLPNSYSVASFQMGRSVLNHSARRREVAPTLQSTTFGTDSTKILFSSVDDIRSSIKGVLFDIDGTLADSWKLGFDATQVVLQKNGIAEITEEIYHDYTKYCTPDRLARHAGFVPEDGHVFFSVGQKLGREFDDFYVNLVSTKTAGFYRGMDNLVSSVPGHIKLGALTNACVAYAEAVLRVNNNVRDRFLTVHGADSVPAPKPMPDGLLQCCKELGLEPSTCVYIGDSPSDAMAAQAAGMPSIGVLWGSHSKTSLANAPFIHLCSTVEELQSLLPMW